MTNSSDFSRKRVAPHLVLLHFLQALQGILWSDFRKLGGIDFYRCFEYGFTAELVRKRGTTGSIILDVGSSDTVLPHYIGVMGHFVLALDIDKKTVFKQKNGLFSSRVQAVVGNGGKLPLVDQCVDIVLALSSIEHAQPPKGDTQIMIEIVRVLKPGGMAIVSVPYSRQYSEHRYDDKRGFVRRYNLGSIEARLVEPIGDPSPTTFFFGNLRAQAVANRWYRAHPYLQFATAASRTALGLITMTPSDETDAGGCLLIFRRTGGEPIREG